MYLHPEAAVGITKRKRERVSEESEGSEEDPRAESDQGSWKEQRGGGRCAPLLCAMAGWGPLHGSAAPAGAAPAQAEEEDGD